MKRLPTFLVCLISVAQAQDSPAKYREYLDAAANFDKFSGTVLMARKGQIVMEQSYGLADRKANTPNTNDTMYRIGSMSKPITAAAVMALRDQGKLKLDDSVCVYLSPCPDAWKAITLTHLLTHTSGMPDVMKMPDYMGFRVNPHTRQQMVELIASSRLCAGGEVRLLQFEFHPIGSGDRKGFGRELREISRQERVGDRGHEAHWI
jgi:CubicO group peptidase (beta-lactamase class C family)